jgi:hypothetical protein
MSWVSKGFVLLNRDVNVNLTKYVQPISATVVLKRQINNLCGGSVLTIVKGDSETLEVSIFDSTGTLVDLTGYEVRFTVKYDDIDENFVFQKKNLAAGGSADEIEMTDPVNGKFEIKINPEDTEPLRDKGNDFVYDIEYKLDNFVKTPIKTTLCMEDDITR